MSSWYSMTEQRNPSSALDSKASGQSGKATPSLSTPIEASSSSSSLSFMVDQHTSGMSGHLDGTGLLNSLRNQQQSGHHAASVDHFDQYLGSSSSTQQGGAHFHEHNVNGTLNARSWEKSLTQTKQEPDHSELQEAVERYRQSCDILGVDPDASFLDILEEIKNGKRPTYLRMNCDDTKMVCVAQELKYCTTLEHLDLSYSELSAAGLMDLVKYLPECKTLRKISMSNIAHIGNEALKTLLPLCESGLPGLECIDVSSTNINAQGVLAARQSLMRNLKDLHKTLDSLTALNLENNSIGVRGLNPLGDLLRYCVNLRVLCIASNQLGDEGAGVLADLLHPEPQGGEYHPLILRTLDVSNNELTAKGGALILSAIATKWRCEPIVKRNTSLGHDAERSLRELIISGNDLDEEFAKTLIMMYHQLGQQLQMVVSTLGKTLQSADLSAAFRVVYDTVSQFSWLSYIDITGCTISEGQGQSIMRVMNTIKSTLRDLQEYESGGSNQVQQFRQMLDALEVTVDGLPDTCTSDMTEPLAHPSEAATRSPYQEPRASDTASSSQPNHSKSDANVEERLGQFREEMEGRVRSIVSEVMNGVVKEAISAVSNQAHGTVLQKVDGVRTDLEHLSESVRTLQQRQEDLEQRLHALEGEKGGSPSHEHLRHMVSEEINSLNERMDELEETVAADQQSSMQALEAILKSTGHTSYEEVLQTNNSGAGHGDAHAYHERHPVPSNNGGSFHARFSSDLPGIRRR
eukprot:gb/GECG01000684.1/.p1 GENE.gb/GECG01000684.1/~~gb/GECG01000684.1/.p1  ORF type:complete len:748 (+),score=103.28 gb/GECG01000684.1/:1-2244(+)